MSDDHVTVISEQFEFVIEKLIQEGYSEVDVLKAISLTMWNFTDGFEEVDEEDEYE